MRRAGTLVAGISLAAAGVAAQDACGPFAAAPPALEDTAIVAVTSVPADGTNGSPAHCEVQAAISASMIATKQGSPLSRQVCPYPELPRYKGAGDPSDAASFECAVR